jgi:hypothetical protein
MYALNYFAPLDLFATLYVGRFVILSWPHAQLITRYALSAILSCVVLQEVVVASYGIYEHKNIVHGKDQVAHAIQARYHAHRGSPLRIVFPFTKPSLVMEFAAFLSHVGVPIEGVDQEQDRVEVLSSAVETAAPCVNYRPVLCHSATDTEPGDIIVVLPDDEVMAAELELYRTKQELLASYDPRPSLPRWLNRFRTILHVAPPRVDRREIPDRWLQAAVFVAQ